MAIKIWTVTAIAENRYFNWLDGSSDEGITINKTWIDPDILISLYWW